MRLTDEQKENLALWVRTYRAATDKIAALEEEVKRHKADMSRGAGCRQKDAQDALHAAEADKYEAEYTLFEFFDFTENILAVLDELSAPSEVVADQWCYDMDAATNDDCVEIAFFSRREVLDQWKLIGGIELAWEGSGQAYAWKLLDIPPIPPSTVVTTPVEKPVISCTHCDSFKRKPVINCLYKDCPAAVTTVKEETPRHD